MGPEEFEREKRTLEDNDALITEPLESALKSKLVMTPDQIGSLLVLIHEEAIVNLLIGKLSENRDS